MVDQDDDYWYCQCAGLMDSSTEGLTTMSLWLFGSWTISVKGFLIFLITAFWFILIGVISGPRFWAFHTRTLFAERSWLLQWFQVWMFAMMFVGLENPLNSYNYGSMLLEGCIFAYISSWFAMFVCSSCPSAARNRALFYKSSLSLAVALGFELRIRRGVVEAGSAPLSDQDRHTLGLYYIAYGLSYWILIIYTIIQRPCSFPTMKTLEEFWANLRASRNKSSPPDHELETQVTQQTGLCSLIAIFLYGISHCIEGVVMMAHNPDSVCYITSILGYIRMALCLRSLFQMAVVFFIPPLYLFDLLLHNFLWGRLCQDAVLQSFAQNVDWRTYRRDPLSWTELDLIAAGAEGTVHLAQLSEDIDVKVVLKKPHIEGAEAVRFTMQEAAILAQVHEEVLSSKDPGAAHIVGFRGFNPTLPEVSLLLEYCGGGDLLHRLADMSRLEHFSETLTQRMMWAYEVAQGMKMLHGIYVAHRDLKTDNILLTTDDKVKISDFGCARAIDTTVDRFATANTGTLAFMAPEVRSTVIDRSLVLYNPMKADVFSFGFLLFEIVTFRREPLSREGSTLDMDIASPVLTERDFRGCPGIEFEGDVSKLIQDCFDSHPESRPSFSEICDRLEPWYQEALSTLRQTLDVKENDEDEETEEERSFWDV